MTENAREKFEYIADAVRNVGYIKHVWENNGSLKILMNLYGNEIFTDAKCSLEDEDKYIIAQRLRRMSVEAEKEYIKCESQGFPNGWLDTLTVRVCFFASNDYFNSILNNL